jgi:hypothetical protein
MYSTLGWYYIEARAGVPLGLYRGETPEDAIAAMDADAGGTVDRGDDWSEHLIVTPVEGLVEEEGYALRITDLVRTALGLTQIQLGDLMGVTSRTVQTWESDGIPDDRTRMALLYLLEHRDD